MDAIYVIEVYYAEEMADDTPLTNTARFTALMSLGEHALANRGYR